MELATQVVSEQEITDLVRELLVEEFDIEPELIKDDATMEELDLDSLDMVEIAQVAEQNWGVRIRAADAEGVTDLGGVIRMIHKKIANPDPVESEESNGAGGEVSSA
jgi:acyl carrier protein